MTIMKYLTMEMFRKKNTGLILKYSYDKDFIRYVTLNKNGIKKRLAVWYLELIAFG